jgi:transposase
MKLSKRNIKEILINKNVWVEGRDKLKKEFSDDEINDIIIKYVNENLSCSVIAKYYGVSKKPINRLLKERGLLREGRSDGKKIELTDEQKYTIKKLYIESHKNSVEIADEIEMNRHFIEKYLHNCNFRRSRGEATSLNQTGKKRSDKVREILKNAQQLFAKSGKRKQMGGVCKKYVIENIECQGTYEKFFIEKLIKENKTLPVNSKSIITPFGVYYPDFEYPQNLIEIKCDYTYEILLGKKNK